MDISIDTVVYQLKEPFIITSGIHTDVVLIIVTLKDGEHIGRGECNPFATGKETLNSTIQIIQSLIPKLKNGMTRYELKQALTHCPARNAIDCALFELEASKEGKSIFDLMNVGFKPLTTVISLTGDRDKMINSISSNEDLYKIKVTSERDIKNLIYIRESYPKIDIILDANGAFDIETLKKYEQLFVGINVLMIEQPLPANNDNGLVDLNYGIDICADESFHNYNDLDLCREKYDLINIKLDKCGGLTTAIDIIAALEKENMGYMIGCNLSSTISIKPILTLVNNAKYIDVDGPLLIEGEVNPCLRYEKNKVYLNEN